MPAAKKASKAPQTKTARKVAAAPKVKAKATVKVMGKPKVTAKAKAAPPAKRSNVLEFKSKTSEAGEPRNIIMELWKAQEEKRRIEAAHTKYHETGPPASFKTNAKHARFGRANGARRRSS